MMAPPMLCNAGRPSSPGFSEKTDFAWVPASVLLSAMRESRNRSTRKVVVKLGGCRYLRLFHKVGGHSATTLGGSYIASRIFVSTACLLFVLLRRQPPFPSTPADRTRQSSATAARLVFFKPYRCHSSHRTASRAFGKPPASCALRQSQFLFLSPTAPQRPFSLL